MKRKQLWIFVVCYFGYTAIYIARLNLSMAAPAMKELGILNPAQLGLLGSVFSVVYALGRLVNGSLGDTCVPWKMICLGLGLVTVSNLLFSLFPPFWGLLILWGGNAYAQSILCCAYWPPRFRRRRRNGSPLTWERRWPPETYWASW